MSHLRMCCADQATFIGLAAEIFHIPIGYDGCVLGEFHRTIIQTSLPQTPVLNEFYGLLRILLASLIIPLLITPMLDI